MYKFRYYIVNSITLYRIITAPVLLLLAVSGDLEVFKWLLALSFFTDSIDGYLARKNHVHTKLGAVLDSIGDDLTVGAAIIGILLFQPDFARERLSFFTALFILYSSQLILALIRYGRISSFHTYSAKISAVLQAVFLTLFFHIGPIYWLFYIAVIFTGLNLIEEIILVIMLPEWQHDVKGLYWYLTKK